MGGDRTHGLGSHVPSRSRVTARLTPPVLERLRDAARERGVMELGAVSLDDPRFSSSHARLDEFLDAGQHGEMEFLARTRALRKAPEGMLPGARSLLVGLVPYRGRSGPIARYAQAADYHTLLHNRLAGLRADLEAALPGVESLIFVDTKPVLERTAAALAGLGFIGKHGCLIAPGLGSYVLIGGLLTTAPWSAAETPVEGTAPWDACGSCQACLDACPTAAFDGPGRLDPRRCISYLTIEHRGAIAEALASRMGERIAGCDVCQEVCPYNRSEARGARVPESAWLADPPGRAREPDLIRLAGIGNAQHRAFVKHTALNRIPRRALRRNALLAIGNGDGPLSAPEREACDRAREDGDAQVRAAAERALRRRGDG